MCFSSPTALTIGQGEAHDNLRYDISECVEMLRSAPNLVACTFKGVYFGNPPTSLVTHSSLKQFDDVEHVLQLIPTVIDLYLWSEDSAFSVIVAIGSRFPPNIRNLMIYGNPDRNEYAQLLSALSARHASGPPLQSSKVLQDENDKDELDENVIAEMRSGRDGNSH
ncbi:hypothetical protein DFH07DRAFT_776812 [Mycena maculata]|uniref:Uncharacterized protein n=1 Tax=Mycena maculata TaxID=230809 RepID=A0AAD7IKH3_9AGAR|nr:hypothetical protein DFH07DRAFT_776812 [Mycena maculata]